MSFILFVVELLATSIVVDDYKYSFFFWLDSIAAISLVPDIPYIIGPMTELYGGTLNTANVNISTTGDRDLAAARTA